MSQEYRDAILDTITIYYLTQSIRRSLRPFDDSHELDAVLTQVPTACARFQNAGSSSNNTHDWQLAGRFGRLVQSTRYPKGGRFAILERPSTVFEDVARFVRELRKLELEHYNDAR